MKPGIYTLVLRMDVEREIAVGALGEILFSEGYYAYTGSARGPGGLKRAERHLEVLKGMRASRRWHIDYLLPHAFFEKAIATATDLDIECRIACRVGERLLPIPGFGCTDCSCISHLHYTSSLDEALSAVEQAHDVPGATGFPHVEVQPPVDHSDLASPQERLSRSTSGRWESFPSSTDPPG